MFNIALFTVLLAAGDAPPLMRDLAIWTLIVFVVLLAVLFKYAWGPVTSALAKREQAIAENIAAARAQHEDAKRHLAEYEQKLASATDEVRQLLEEARRDADHTKIEILAEAKAAAQSEHDRVLRDVRNAKDAALKEIGEAGANLSIELAARIVRAELTHDDETRLVRDAVASFPSEN